MKPLGSRMGFLMKKLLSVSAFLLVVGFTVGSIPARAIIRPCDTFCAGQSGGFSCTCPADSVFPNRNSTCSNYLWDCYYP
jgi:hypothetical protein